MSSSAPSTSLTERTASNAEQTNHVSQALKPSQKKLEPYEIGLHNELKKRSKVGDNLDLHHALQQKPAQQAIKSYNPKTVPTIVLPSKEHKKIPTIKGQYNDTPRNLLAKDIQDLRQNTQAPNSALQKLIAESKKAYPQNLNK